MLSKPTLGAQHDLLFNKPTSECDGLFISSAGHYGLFQLKYHKLYFAKYFAGHQGLRANVI
jgi:hypothetical protein